MTQSPELAGGAGFTYEESVASSYVAALLQQASAPGTGSRIVTRVALQQRDAGEPLDDVIVDCSAGSGDVARVSLQVKRSLTISSGQANSIFRDVIRDCWLTLSKPDFRIGLDKFGIAVDDVAPAKLRGLRFVADLASASTTPAEFLARFTGGGHASKPHRAIKADIVKLIRQAKGSPPTPEEEHRFFAHLALVEFDFLHAGSASETNALNAVRSCLDGAHQSQAVGAWAEIQRLVREGQGKAEIFDRPKLVRKLAPSFRLTGSASLRGDLAAVTNLTRQWLADIDYDVGGEHLDRVTTRARLATAQSDFRIVQIVGLPGSGKSVLLRGAIESELTKGSVLLIKSGRLDGTGWSSFAAANGLSGAPLTDFLVEIGAVGSTTLFVDGIDRIEKQHRPIIVDLVRAILTDPLLDNWQIVMSLRDSGIEPLRNWLGAALAGTTVQTVEVKPLDDTEATALAKAKPHLQPLLFGSREVREIVRRPFFAKVLDQNFAAGGSADFSPQSETDLIDNWWNRGGYDAEGQGALDRQRAIVELGSLRARHLEQEIEVRDLTRATSQLIDQFVADGIVQHVRSGHTIRFAHDIFFEWAFFHALLDQRAAWPDEVKACGEPPAIARVVELLSQSLSDDPKAWLGTLHQLDRSGLRSQWMRAWLLAPFTAPNFLGFAGEYAKAVEADGHMFLAKALVWFQAERTTPNPAILTREEIEREERIRMADLFGWPSDFGAWRRFLEFLLARMAGIPVRLRPDVLAVFEVWQNAIGGIPNDLSNALLDLAAQWLTEIELESQATCPPPHPSAWSEIQGSIGEFRASLARLIFRGAAMRPELTGNYLSLLLRSEGIREKTFEEISTYSPLLASTHSDQIVELSLKFFQGELPEDRVSRERKERARSSERSKAALAKPPEARTRVEELAASGALSMLGGHSFGFHDWDALAIHDGGHFFPASPLREPFHSLFSNAPADALKLLRMLSNHAMSAWRQLHRLSYDDQGTPIPLDLVLPWGTQRFWGTEREYQWSRGMWGPKPLLCAYLALEDWAFAEFERGRPVDELIQQILEGNDCIAVLAVASALIVESEVVSETGFAFLTSHRVLIADEARSRQDFGGSQASLIGFMRKSDIPHAEAVKKINARAIRKKKLSFEIPRYFLMAGEEMSERIKAAILDFPAAPPFLREEHREIPEIRDRFIADAREYAELVDLANYQRAQIGNDPDQVAIVHVSPTGAAPENTARRAEAGRWLRQSSLWMWASKFFDDGELGDNFTTATAIEFAKDLEANPVKRDSSESDDINAQGALAAAAAMALRHRDGLNDRDLEWARDALRRALAAPESRDMFWSPQSVIPWHPGVFAAHGFEADIRLGTANPDAVVMLFVLIAHPLECVSKAAVGAALRLWSTNPHLSWTALHLALSLCTVPPQPRDPHRDQPHTAEALRAAVIGAIERYEASDRWPALPMPPAPWVKSSARDRSAEAWEEDDDDLDESDFVDPTDHWVASPTWWNSKVAADVFARIPVEEILRSDAKNAIEAAFTGHLAWTILKMSPPGAKPGRQNRASRHFEWTHSFGQALGRMIGCYPYSEAKPLFLDPIFGLEDEACWDLLNPVIDMYVRRYVYDGASVPDDAPELLQTCLERVLSDRTFVESSYRAGSLTGTDLPGLVDTLMFVAVERANLAARYVNGDWSEISRIVPIVDRFVRAAGWSTAIMSKFLTLCERAKDYYPAEAFADQVLDVVGKPGRNLQSWHGTVLPARIAGLIQHFADRETPMSVSLGQKLLRGLDLLIDMGDRRSAALQYSEPFREVQSSADEPKL